MTAALVRVGEIAEQVRGVTYGKDDASDVPDEGYVPVLRAGNITDSGIVLDNFVYVPEGKVSKKQFLRSGDVLIAASSGSLDAVGKAGPVLADFDGAFGAFCKVLRPNQERVDARYFSHFFRTPEYRRIVSSLAAGANINNLRNEHLDNLLMPLPAIAEQRRVAAILDKADALRTKRRQVLAYLDCLAQSLFVEMFGDPVTNSRGWPDEAVLGDVADIVSGVTKGRKLEGKVTRQVPYLAVSNVQDMRLSLSGIKSIDATDDEIDRYALRDGDLLLTEGGDPDKLGRGTLWRAELPECIHQNHVFRVRLNSSRLTPFYLNWLVGSQRGKRYFLRSAKQTTGIASINMTQLRSFPLLVPPIDIQRRFQEVVGKLHLNRRQMASAADFCDSLFASIQCRAFRGEL